MSKLDTSSSVLFDDYTLQELFRQVVNNSRENRAELKKQLQRLSDSIENTMDLQIFVSQIQGFMNTLVKNDQMLLKLAGVVAKIAGDKARMLQQGQNQNTLTQQQKDFILKQAKQQINEIIKADDVKKKLAIS